MHIIHTVKPNPVKFNQTKYQLTCGKSHGVNDMGLQNLCRSWVQVLKGMGMGT